MTFAKYLSAAILAAPIFAVGGQSAPSADSGRKADRAAWVAGTATGGALFLLFAQHDHSPAGGALGDGLGGFTAQTTGPSGPSTGPAKSPIPSPDPSPPRGSAPGDHSSNPPGNQPGTPTPPTPHTDDNGSSGLSFVNAPGPGGQAPAGPNDPRDDGVTPPPVSQEPPPAANEPEDSPPAGGGSMFTPGPPSGTHDQFFEALGETSTVPEPGPLALTATGIIGLIPLVRRRK